MLLYKLALENRFLGKLYNIIRYLYLVEITLSLDFFATMAEKHA